MLQYRNGCMGGLLILLFVATNCPAQSRPAPWYSLPPDGTWVEFDWELTRGDQQWNGTLRISSVGQEENENAVHRWIEVENRIHRDEMTRRDVRKLLIDEHALSSGVLSVDNVIRGLSRRNNGDVRTTHRESIARFLDMGFPGPETRLKEIRREAPLKTPLGRFIARHLRADVNLTDGRRTYDGWLSPEVPFGVARFEVREWVGENQHEVFKAVVGRTGNRAESRFSNEAAQ